MANFGDLGPTMASIYVLVVCILALNYGPRSVAADECGTKFTDPTSSTVLAQVVLQGKVKDMISSPNDARPSSANVIIDKVYKGMNILENPGMMQDKVVRVTQFGKEDKVNCVASMKEMEGDHAHIFFLRQTSNQGVLQLSAMPIHAEDDMERRVTQSMCATCVRPPDIRKLTCSKCVTAPKMRDMKTKKVQIGKPIQLKCFASGEPAVSFSWFKDRKPVVPGVDGVKIKTTATRSVLIFKKATNAHAGMYKCVASNIIGKDEKEVHLDVVNPRKAETGKYTFDNVPDKVTCEINHCLLGATCYFSAILEKRQCLCPPGIEGKRCRKTYSDTIDCPVQTSCLNGGQCKHSVALNVQFCECPLFFMGRRCEILDTLLLELLTENKTRNNIDTSEAKMSNKDETEKSMGKETADRHAMVKQMISRDDNTELPGNEVTSPDTYASLQSLTSSPVVSDFTPTLPPSTQSPVVSDFTPTLPPSTRSPVVSDSTPTSPPSTRSQNSKMDISSKAPAKQTQRLAGEGRAVNAHTSGQSVSENGNIQRKDARPDVSSNIDLADLKSRLRNPHLKIKYCKDKMFCLNGGSCKYVVKLDIKFCECPVGFDGLRCEISTNVP